MNDANICTILVRPYTRFKDKSSKTRLTLGHIYPFEGVYQPINRLYYRIRPDIGKFFRLLVHIRRTYLFGKNPIVDRYR
jgi:hypothetical protein